MGYGLRWAMAAVMAGCAAFSVAPGRVLAAPVQWATGSGGNGHWYELVIDTTKGWTAARDDAVARGGHLVTITSAGEQAFLVSTFFTVGSGYGSYWIGATDAPSEGSWSWVTGETFSYANWGIGQPDNNSSPPFGDGLAGEDYAQFVWRADGATPHEGRWNDAREAGYAAIGGLPHLDRMGYIVEYRSLPVAEPMTLALFPVGLVALAGARLRRRSSPASGYSKCAAACASSPKPSVAGTSAARSACPRPWIAGGGPLLGGRR